MAVFNNQLAGAAGQGGAAAYQIERSLRFDEDATAFLERTPSSAGNRKTWTWSGWVKRSSEGYNYILLAYQTSPYLDTGIAFNASDQLYVYNYDSGGWNGQVTTDAVFRDYSAWYHVVVVYDTTDATPVKIYVNGEQQSTSGTQPTSNSESNVNNTVSHKIGRYEGSTTISLDGYLADVHFIDGQALAPTDFGEYDSNNVWQPKAYSGTYGTNGFHLDFSDNSSNAALGDDSSGNNNDWTVNNISVSNGNGSYLPGLTASYTNCSQSGSISNMFDGSTSTAAVVSGSNTHSVTYTLASGKSYSSSVRFYALGASAGAGQRYVLLNGSRTNHNTTGWITVATGSGTISSFGTGADNTNDSGIFAIEVDGVILVDYAAGGGNDSLIDTPTNYESESGNNRGNYATLNPLTASDQYALITNGNLDFNVTTGTTWSSAMSTIAIKSEKIYFEYGVTTTSPNSGISGAGAFVAVRKLDNQASWAISGADNFTLRLGDTGYLRNGTVSDTLVTSANPAVGDIFGFAIDGTNGTYAIYENGTLLSSGSLSLSGYTAGDALIPWVAKYPNIGGVTYGCFSNFNFGQRQFAYPPGSSGGPSSDFKSHCTTNLTDPLIEDGSDYFEAKTYTGTGSSQTISGLEFSPDFVWIKNRADSSGGEHRLLDTIRGATKVLYSNLTNSESTESQSLTAFTSDGFTVGTGNYVNGSGDGMIAWCWDAGTTTATNTDGSITSNVRANQSAGFSIVGYSSGSAGNYTVGHGLGSTPEFIITKARNGSTYNWVINHTSIATTVNKYLAFTANAVLDNGSAIWGANLSDTNSTTFGISTGNGVEANKDCIAYCFAPVAGYSAFGSYTGNGSSTDGTFVYTGFRPKYLLVKASSHAVGWYVLDSTRNEYNTVSRFVLPNSSNAEVQGGAGAYLDFVSNGFKWRANNTAFNASSYTYIYAAFAEHPFKTARAR